MNTSFQLALLRYRLFRLGWPAMLGLALACSAAATELIAVKNAEADLQKLHKSRSVLRMQLAQAAQQESAPGLQLEQLQERQKVDLLLAELHAAAHKHAVVLDQGEYRLQAEQGTRLARYRMIIPAHANYLQLRAWLDEVAANQPGLQIDDLAFKRENITQEGLEARVSFSLLVRTS